MASASAPSAARPMKQTVSVSRTCSGGTPRPSRCRSIGGPLVDVVVVSAPAASPATEAGRCAVSRAARPASRSRRASPRSAAPPPAARAGSPRRRTRPGAANSSIVTAERLSGCGVRCSVSSVSRLISSAEDQQQHHRGLGLQRREHQRRGDEAEPEPGRGLQHRPERDGHTGGGEEHAANLEQPVGPTPPRPRGRARGPRTTCRSGVDAAAIRAGRRAGRSRPAGGSSG